MTRLRSIALCLLLVLAGCADGGPVGTGISSLSGISGNVVAVDDTGTTSAAPGVRVSIDQAPGLESVTDSEGNFDLSGDFAGPVTLRFRTDSLTATQTLEVPDNSNLVLQDVVVSPGQVRFEAARVLGFFGQVAMVDCTDGTMLVNDRRQVSNQFLVRLTEDTVLVRGDGKAVACADISPGNRVAIEGAVRFVDRTITAFTVTVGPPPPGERPPVSQVRFHGRVAVVSCQGEMLLLSDPTTGRTRLRLTAQTTIVGPTGMPLTCDMIQIGDRADGGGTINVRRPEVVEAQTLVIRPPR